MANILLGLIVLTIILLAIFIITHIRPLSQDEIKSLANNRRQKNINHYFIFKSGEYSVNKEFKSRMKPNGKFYSITEDLYDFPPIAAALLKYKKHEWILIAFEKMRKIDLIWINKGMNRESVASHLPTEEIINIGKEHDFSSVLIFHNHPNRNPNMYDCSKPSEQDLISARGYSEKLDRNGINLIEFICERGRHYRYFFSISDFFMPIKQFITDVNRVNGYSKIQNLKLHVERLFSIGFSYTDNPDSVPITPVHNRGQNLDNPVTWKKSGNEFFNHGQYQDAIKCYNRAIELNPEYIEAWNNLGLSFQKLGNTEEARKCNNRIRELKKKMK